MQKNKRKCFNVAGGLHSGTKETCAQKGQWRGDLEPITVIDTPGFGDTENGDTFETDYKHVKSLVKFLKTNTPSITTFLICIQGQNPRMNTGLRLMLVQLENIFGEDFWKNVVLEFTKYSFSKHPAKLRAEAGDTEDGRKNEMNTLLKKYFGFQVRSFHNIFKHRDL